jgi:lysophospholipase L1-like esterase
MKHSVTPLLCFALLPFWTAPFSNAAPEEKDPRLQADGPGWKLNKAAMTDSKLPRVLLIGDSILNGYGNAVIKSLEGRAYVDSWVNPYCQSEHTNAVLGEVLKNGPYDVVHFNLGLHGWQAGRIKEGTFEPLTRAYVGVIQRNLPKARIIWANTTPVTIKGSPTELDPAINAVIQEHNRMADAVMKSMNIPINDFYAALSPKLELARGDQFHWKNEAYAILAAKTVDAVNAALENTK